MSSHQNNGEDKNEEVYIQAYNINTNEGVNQRDHSTLLLHMGATHHLTYQKDGLKEYQELSAPLSVVFGDNAQKLVMEKVTFSW